MGTVHLVGGGRDAAALVPLYARFVEDAAIHAASGDPRIALLLMLEAGDTDTASRQLDLLRAAGASDVTCHAIPEGERFADAAVEIADGIAVGGGLTPAYLDAVQPIAPLLRARIAAGAAYLGFSAGAAIAARRSLVGGYLLDEVVVCDEDAGEDLSSLTVRDGLGLVPFTVDVHAAQWGTLSRLVAAVGGGLTDEGIAIDEHTAVTVTDTTSDAAAAAAGVSGTGAAWHVVGSGPVGVSRHTAS